MCQKLWKWLREEVILQWKIIIFDLTCIKYILQIVYSLLALIWLLASGQGDPSRSWLYDCCKSTNTIPHFAIHARYFPLLCWHNALINSSKLLSNHIGQSRWTAETQQCWLFSYYIRRIYTLGVSWLWISNNVDGDIERITLPSPQRFFIFS